MRLLDCLMFMPRNMSSANNNNMATNSNNNTSGFLSWCDCFNFCASEEQQHDLVVFQSQYGSIAGDNMVARTQTGRESSYHSAKYIFIHSGKELQQIEMSLHVSLFNKGSNYHFFTTVTRANIFRKLWSNQKFVKYVILKCESYIFVDQKSRTLITRENFALVPDWFKKNPNATIEFIVEGIIDNTEDYYCPGDTSQ
jgi:hypothetical protein